MNKTAIKNFAIWARVQLIEAAKQRAYEYEITEKGENISFVGSKGSESAEKNRQYYKSKYSTKDHKNQRKRKQKSAVEHNDSADKTRDSKKFAKNKKKEHCHSVLGVKNLVIIVFYVCVHKNYHPFSM